MTYPVASEDPLSIEWLALKEKLSHCLGRCEYGGSASKGGRRELTLKGNFPWHVPKRNLSLEEEAMRKLILCDEEKNVVAFLAEHGGQYPECFNNSESSRLIMRGLIERVTIGVDHPVLVLTPAGRLTVSGVLRPRRFRGAGTVRRCCRA